MVMVVVEAKIIRHSSFAVNPARVGVEALHSRSASERWKRADDVAGRPGPAQPHIQIISRPAPAASAPRARASKIPQRWRGAKIMDEPHTDRVRVCLGGSHVMKILCGNRQVGQRNVVQERLSLKRDESRIHYVGLSVEVELLPRRRVVNRRRQRGKISSAFRSGRHCRKCVVRRTPAPAVPAYEKKCLASSVVDLRNVQRAADIRSKPGLIVVGPRQLDAAQRIGPGIHRGSIVGKIQETVRLIYIESAPAQPDHHRSGATRTAAESSPAKTSATAETSKSHLLRPIAKFLD